jgi:hypothetical protein
MTTEMTVLVEFELVDPVQRTWKVRGTRNMESIYLDLVDPPAYFAKDEVVVLEPLCKYPLDDYRDTRQHSQTPHSYIFIKANGTQEEGILDGFSHNATYTGAGTCNAQPRVVVAMRKVDVAAQAQSRANARESDNSEGAEGSSVDNPCRSEV